MAYASVFEILVMIVTYSGTLGCVGLRGRGGLGKPTRRFGDVFKRNS